MRNNSAGKRYASPTDFHWPPFPFERVSPSFSIFGPPFGWKIERKQRRREITRRSLVQTSNSNFDPIRAESLASIFFVIFEETLRAIDEVSRLFRKNRTDRRAGACNLIQYRRVA